MHALSVVAEFLVILSDRTVLAQSRSLSFEGDSDSGPYLFHLDFCVILWQSILLLCNLFCNKKCICTLLCTF